MTLGMLFQTILRYLRIQYNLVSYLDLPKTEIQLYKFFELFQNQFRYFIPDRQTLIFEQNFNLKKHDFIVQVLLLWNYEILAKLDQLYETLTMDQIQTSDAVYVLDVFNRICTQIIQTTPIKPRISESAQKYKNSLL